MPDFFQDQATPKTEAAKKTPDLSGQPLAARMRPRVLDEIVGQQHILAPGKLLRRAIESDRFTSLIFYGPPGTGKTTLASVIAKSTGSRFESINGVESNVAEIRAKIEAASGYQKLRDQTTILFIDEIHRFNKAQQDTLLPHLERGTVRFIGATTHNPYFYVNSPLVSRSQIFQLDPVAADDLLTLLHRAIADKERGFGKKTILADPDALRHIATKADGDARKALTALELAILTTPESKNSTTVSGMRPSEGEAGQSNTTVPGVRPHEGEAALQKNAANASPETHARDGRATDADPTPGEAALPLTPQPTYLNDLEKITAKKGPALPHWTQQNATYAVTFRLADSLPQQVVQNYLDKKKNLQQIRDKALKDEDQSLAKQCAQKLRDNYHEEIESALEDAHGECLLKKKQSAEIVENALKHFDHARFDLFAYAIAPNHVHAILKPINDHDLNDILYSLKSFTAKEINKVLGRKGTLWQNESYDHVIRDIDDYLNQRDYILRHPTEKKFGHSLPTTHARDGRATESNTTVPGVRPYEGETALQKNAAAESPETHARDGRATPRIHLTLAIAEESIQQKAILYDADGDQHYDTISAFIKSIRGSDPDAALYWLAKMLTAGEEPRFIARRLVIAASEDIGLADSSALQVAIAAQQALEFVGMPEGRIPLAHATVHLATAPKSNSAYAALGEAMSDVASGKTLPVPAHLQTKFRKKIATESGADTAAMQYLYSHDYDGNFTPQAYLPEGRTYYQPTRNGLEKRIAERIDHWREKFNPEK